MGVWSERMFAADGFESRSLFFYAVDAICYDRLTDIPTIVGWRRCGDSGTFATVGGALFAIGCLLLPLFPTPLSCYKPEIPAAFLPLAVRNEDECEFIDLP